MKKLTILLIFFSLIIESTCTQDKASEPDRFAWWQEARFGMFIHWGVCSLYGGVNNGHQQARGDAAWILNRCKGERWMEKV